MLAREVTCLLSAVQFLTRLPMPAIDWQAGQLARSMRYFPVVGLLIGALMAAAWILASLALPSPLAATVAIATGIAVTGALHEDGLADTLDGLGGHAGRERALEIMRDSRIGTYGVVALIISVTLKVQALAALPVVEGALALLLAATLGRAVMVPGPRLTCPARSDGSGASVAGGPATRALLVASASTMAVVIVIGWSAPLAVMTATLTACAAAAMGLLWSIRRIGGYTGDTLGAMCQLAEVATLVCLAAFWAGP